MNLAIDSCFNSDFGTFKLVFLEIANYMHTKYDNLVSFLKLDHYDYN